MTGTVLTRLLGLVAAASLMAACGGNDDEVLRSGIDKGVFRTDCEAQDLFISLNGMGYFLLSNQYTLSVILGRNLSTPKALKRHEDHIVAVVLGYLRRGGG